MDVHIFGAIFGGGWAAIIGNEFGLPYGPELFVVGAIGAVIGSIAWLYSPLPNHNGGFGRPPARMQKWGFTSEPRHDDYQQPTAEQVWSPAVPSGWMFAERETGDE